MAAKIYVITNYAFNHSPNSPPLDERFLGKENCCFYLIDKSIPPILKNEEVLQEYLIDPSLHAAGGKFFGEWSFLLAEMKHRIVSYPFFMVSSRFYQKNRWLHGDLNSHRETLSLYLSKYGFGYLPSYDRPIRFIRIKGKEKLKNEARFCPFTHKFYDLVAEYFGVILGKDYRQTADLFCNYIGFQSREDLENYVNFYAPMIDFFFDENYQEKVPVGDYAIRSGYFKNEKPFTFILEMLSHLYFFSNNKNYFCLHYDGYYEVNEVLGKVNALRKIPISPIQKAKRFLLWQKRRIQTEGVWAKIKKLGLRLKTFS